MKYPHGQGYVTEFLNEAFNFTYTFNYMDFLPQASIGKIVSSYRISRGLRIDETAKLVGVAPETLSHIERGLYKPKPLTERKIMVRLGLAGELPSWKSLGHHITEKRLSKLISSKELAKLTGVARCTIEAWELNRNLPNPYNLKKLNNTLSLISDVSNDFVFEAGVKLLRHRQKHRMTRKQAAEMIGVFPDTVKAWERYVQFPTGEHVEKIKNITRSTLS